MNKRSVKIKQVFQPQDTTAFVVIALGLFIALFLDEMAVRLIGVCIAVLGGVALFMMVSPRLTELSMMRPPRPSDSPNIKSETNSDGTKVSTVFDKEAYQRSFGKDEQESSNFNDDSQFPLFEPPSVKNPVKVQAFAGGDESSSVTLVGVTKGLGTAQAPTLVIETKKKSREEKATIPVGQGSAAIAPVTIGPITGAVQLSDEIVIRPISKPTAKPVTPTPPSPPQEFTPRPRPVIGSALQDETESTASLNEFDEYDDFESSVVILPPSKTSAIVINASEREYETSGTERKNDLDETNEEPVALDVDGVEEQSGDAARDEHGTSKEEEDSADAEGIAPGDTDDVAAIKSVIGNTHNSQVVEPRVSSHAATEVKARRRTPEVSVNPFTDESDEEMGTFEEPRREFDYLLGKVLMVIRSATNARTAAFFWVNHEKQELVLEAKITDAKEHFTENRKIPLGRDAVSQIAIDNRPEILNQISPSAELDLIPYYKNRTGTVSFVGVPVYYGSRVVGVLCADSMEEDAYSEVTVGFFGHFTKLISGLVTSYTSKFDLIQASKTLDALQLFKDSMQGLPNTVPDLTTALFDSVVRTLDVNTVGICLYNSDDKNWFVSDAQSVVQGYENVVGVIVDITDSTVGNCITSGKTVISASAPGIVRVASNEPTMEDGQFVAIPLRTSERTYGAVYFENHLSTLATQDISIIEDVVREAGLLIEQIFNVQMLREAALLDVNSGVLNRSGFDLRLREEFARTVDYQTPLTVCTIKLDKSKVVDDASSDQVDTILQHIVSSVQDQLRDYDVIGRIGRTTFAIALINYKAQDAQRWADNLRRQLASTVIDVNSKRFSVTVSIGVAEAHPRDDWKTLTQNSLRVLAESERAGNKVTVFG